MNNYRDPLDMSLELLDKVKRLSDTNPQLTNQRHV